MEIEKVQEKLRYKLHFDLKRHHIRVHLEIPFPDPKGQRLEMATWVPGGYLIRDFAKHILSISAFNIKGPVSLKKTDTNAWVCEPCEGPLTIGYTIYAFEKSIRGAYVEQNRVFFDGVRVFLHPIGYGHCLCELWLDVPLSHWHIASAMQEHPEKGPSWFLAQNYEELIDHPFELGVFTSMEFHVYGVLHFIHLSGKHYTYGQRLVRDVRSICETIVNFFGRPAPMPHYHFFLNVCSKGSGGLEHRDSTVMMCGREDLPSRVMAPQQNYRNLLGLFSHEYFHAWWVKRVRPERFMPYDLSQPILTELLWVFEGFTAYYDDLILLRAGVINAKKYLELLGSRLTKLIQTPGRFFQALADASVDAWIKYYKPDENTVNSSISYYVKGCIVALCLDLKLRIATASSFSLDDILRHFWKAYLETGKGLTEKSISSYLHEIGYQTLAEWLESVVHGTDELPFSFLLNEVGVKVEQSWIVYEFANQDSLKGQEEGWPILSFGMRLETFENELKVGHVLIDSPAMQAGFCPGDILVALDGLRITKQSYLGILTRLGAGQSVKAQIFRDDVLTELYLTIPSSEFSAISLNMKTDLSEHSLLLRQSWLGS